MTKDMKIVLIVVASIVGLLAIAFVLAFVVLGVFVSHSVAGDDASKAKAAAKIATFTVPPGYKIGMAMDLAMIDTAIIVPSGGRHGAFVMELEGMSASPQAQNADSTLKTFERGVGSGAQCTAPRETGIDTLETAAHAKVDLHAFACTNGHVMELGTIPSHFPYAVLVAAGTTDTFDHQALRQLVSSIRN